jgi:hypothetical protein
MHKNSNVKALLQGTLTTASRFAFRSKTLAHFSADFSIASESCNSWNNLDLTACFYYLFSTQVPNFLSMLYID